MHETLSPTTNLHGWWNPRDLNNAKSNLSHQVVVSGHVDMAGIKMLTF